MKPYLFALLFGILPLQCLCQYRHVPGREPAGMRHLGRQGKRTASIERVADGFAVYENDTIKGLITLDRKDLYIEKPLNDQYSTYYEFKMKDTRLKSVMMYNVDKKPLYIARVQPDDKRMMRVVHEGKLNIYDDRLNYIYNPADIDKNLIVVVHNGIVDDLGSFLTETTKRDLIGYVNDIYGLKIDPKTISWKDLLVKVDGLD